MSKNRTLVNTVAVEGVLQVPTGTTAQRPSSPVVGYVRYNTTLGFLEQYTGDGWQGIAPPPTIASVSPTTYNGEQGTLFTINGSNFDSTVTVKFITAQGAEYSAATVSRINNSQLTATTPQDFTVANEPLKIKVVNGSGLSYTLDNAIDCGGVPTWNTSAGTIATIDDAYGSYSPIVSLSAGDPDVGATVSYSVTSGSLPGNVSLNSSTGAISGDPNNVTAQTAYNFTASANDNAGNQTTRSFSIIVNPYRDGTTSARAASNPATIVATGATSGDYWITDGSNTFQNYIYITGGQAWIRVAYMTTNRQLATGGNKSRDTFMGTGGSYDTSTGNVNSFSSTSRLTSSGDLRGYWGHQSLYNFSNNAGTVSPFIKVFGTNQSSQSVDKNFRIKNYTYNSGDSSAFDAVPGLLNTSTGSDISGSLAHFCQVGDTNSRGSWGSTGTAVPGGHYGIGLREGGPSGAEAGGPGALQWWHYGDYGNYMNISFSNDNGTQSVSYSALQTFTFLLFLKV